MDIRVRQMSLSDLTEVERIENESFKTPWSREIYQKEIEENQFAYYYVLEYLNQVIGFVGVWLVLDEAQVTNIAVDPSFRGKGFGRILFHYMLNKVAIKGARQLSLEVRESNQTAQKLYQSFGLQHGGIRKQYYTDNDEDAIVMWKKL